MSGLISRLRSFLGISAPLRNKKDGLAFIKSYGHEYGADAIAGQIVKTVRFEGGFWMIDPQPVYTVTGAFQCGYGNRHLPGDCCKTTGLIDSVLEPIGSPGEGERDESLNWLPVPPVLIPLKVVTMTRDA